MRAAQKIAATALVIALGGAVYGIVRAGEAASAATTRIKKAAATQLVDQTALDNARQLAQMADSEDEKAIAIEVLKIGDREVDLAFDIALRSAEAHPVMLSAEAKAIQARLQQAQKLQEGLQAQVTQLMAEVAKATGDKKQSLSDQLDLAKSALDLADGDVADAEGDLNDAGGNQRARIAQLKQAHESAEKGITDVKFPEAGAEQLGLVHRYQQWSALRQKMRFLIKAKADADTAATAAMMQHNELAEQIENEKKNSPDLAAHSASGSGTSDDVANAAAQSVRKARTHEESKATVTLTKAVAADQHNLSSLDKRGSNERDLSDLYSQWMSLVSVREGNVMKLMLIGVTIVLALLLIVLFFDSWLEKLLGTMKLDRRRVQTLRAVARVTLQVASVLMVLLVILGPPTQLGTFIGLATAGLTVALKDFIVGFIGWFVLMGKNGIRLGDWVEINGVTGEVAEIGMFHTVLLETGNWTDSGHPTGRRVTFTNSYAIEGHYFNFSTSGQWLWDELQVTIPEGRDPFPLVEAIQQKVLEATQNSTEQAEREWQRAAGSREMSSISAVPAINMRPAPAGIEVQVRYVTRANERYQLRTKLYQTLVELLGGRGPRILPKENPT
jgi:small-conductance mechanosensitive channel